MDWDFQLSFVEYKVQAIFYIPLKFMVRTNQEYLVGYCLPDNQSIIWIFMIIISLYQDRLSSHNHF